VAWCPFAIHKPLSENHTQGAIVPRAVILHTAVSASDSLFSFFQNNSNLESHFYVTEEGVVEQYMDTQIMADANKNANAFAVSIETEDGRQIKPWTPAQLAMLIRLVTWICDTHHIPKVQIPTAYGSGIGWHVMFGAPGPWTPVSKSCPGTPRIAQTRAELIPAVARGTQTKPIIPEEYVKLATPEWLPNSQTFDDADKDVDGFVSLVLAVECGSNSTIVDVMWLNLVSSNFGDTASHTEYQLWIGGDNGNMIGFGDGSADPADTITGNDFRQFVLKSGSRVLTLKYKNTGKARAGISFPQRGK
jgi:hypothetical protein